MPYYILKQYLIYFVDLISSKSINKNTLEKYPFLLAKIIANTQEKFIQYRIAIIAILL